jgi:hypothetical protein
MGRDEAAAVDLGSAVAVFFSSTVASAFKQHVEHIAPT